MGYGAIVTVVSCCSVFSSMISWATGGNKLKTRGILLCGRHSWLQACVGVCGVQLSRRFVGAHRWQWWVYPACFSPEMVGSSLVLLSIEWVFGADVLCWRGYGLLVAADHQLVCNVWACHRSLEGVSFHSRHWWWALLHRWLCKYRVGKCTTGFDLWFWKAVCWNFPPNVY